MVSSNSSLFSVWIAEQSNAKDGSKEASFHFVMYWDQVSGWLFLLQAELASTI